MLPRDVSPNPRGTAPTLISSFEKANLGSRSAFRTFQEHSIEVKNARLKADMEKLVATANAELNLFNDKLSGQ